MHWSTATTMFLQLWLFFVSFSREQLVFIEVAVLKRDFHWKYCIFCHCHCCLTSDLKYLHCVESSFEKLQSLNTIWAKTSPKSIFLLSACFSLCSPAVSLKKGLQSVFYLVQYFLLAPPPPPKCPSIFLNQNIFTQSPPPLQWIWEADWQFQQWKHSSEQETNLSAPCCCHGNTLNKSGDSRQEREGEKGDMIKCEHSSILIAPIQLWLYSYTLQPSFGVQAHICK